MKCVLCGKEVNRDGSFSNRGENVQCVNCVEKLSLALGCSTAGYVKRYVWPFRDKDVVKVKRLLEHELVGLAAQKLKLAKPWYASAVSSIMPKPERYRCHSHTRGFPVDKHGHFLKNWNMFENGMEVLAESPVDFSGKVDGLVVVRRQYEDDYESGRIVVPLDIFRKCFTKIKEG